MATATRIAPGPKREESRGPHDEESGRADPTRAASARTACTE